MTTFRATPEPLDIYCGRLAVALRDLKTRLQARYEHRFPGEGVRIRDAIAKAEEAAWHTEYPHLFLPDLAEEAVARLSASTISEHEDGISSFANMP